VNGLECSRQAIAVERRQGSQKTCKVCLTCDRGSIITKT
jgi:hypothetical protein